MTPQDSKKLTGKAAFVLAIATGKTIIDAAFEAGIGERQAYRWLQQPDIQQQIETAQGELISRAVKRLAGTASQAVETMTELLDDEASNIRLAASRAILSHLIDLQSHTQLEARISKLEEQFAAQKG